MTIVRWNQQEQHEVDYHTRSGEKIYCRRKVVSGFAIRMFGDDDDLTGLQEERYGHRSHVTREDMDTDRAIVEFDHSARAYLDPSPVANNGPLFTKYAQLNEPRLREENVSPKDLRYWRSGNGATLMRRYLCSRCSEFMKACRYKKSRSKLTADDWDTYRRCLVCTKSHQSPFKPLRWMYEAWLTWLADKLLEQAEADQAYRQAFEDCLELGSIPPTWPEWRAEMNPTMRLSSDSPPLIFTDYMPILRPGHDGRPKVLVKLDGFPIVSVSESTYEQEV